MNCNSSTPELPLQAVPSAMVTFGSLSGGVRVIPAAWVGIVCANPLSLLVAVRTGRIELCRERPFAVNLPAGDLLASPFLSKMPADMEDGFPSSVGLTFSAGKVKGVFLIEECPVRIECCWEATRSRFGQDFIYGEVMAVHADEACLVGDRLPTSPDRLKPFTRVWNRCLSPWAGRAQA
jgi:flavin reductase (DIM6/NTAB) family NADH-FMN oxidoreductase RutF